MNVAALYMLLAGLLVPAGFIGLLSSAKRIDEAEMPKLASSPSRLSQLRFTRLHGIALATALAAFIVTGWPVMAIGFGLGVWFVPSVLGGGKAALREVARTEGVAQWTRRLADLLGSGAVGSLDMAIRRSGAACPAAIAPEVQALINRIGPQGIEPALRQFAHEVDNRAAEKVVGSLILRARHGGRGLAEVLTGLATDMDDRVRMVREIEAERAKPRSNARTIVMVCAVLIVGEVLFTRSFLKVYSTFIGEMLLAVNLMVFAFALRWLRRVSLPARDARVLVDPRPGRST